jgi:hypothetical protein
MNSGHLLDLEKQKLVELEPLSLEKSFKRGLVQHQAVFVAESQQLFIVGGHSGHFKSSVETMTAIDTNHGNQTFLGMNLSGFPLTFTCDNQTTASDLIQRSLLSVPDEFRSIP